jgi:transcriptional regulator with XRE-family HTH domain
MRIFALRLFTQQMYVRISDNASFSYIFLKVFFEMEITPTELPENIKKIRERWKLSQEDFATLMQSKRGRIGHYEAGNNDPSLSFMLLLQYYTQISINDLCRKKLALSEILTKPAAGLFEVGKEKLYGESALHGYVGEDPPLSGSDWYSFHFLVLKIKEMDDKINTIYNKLL